MRLLDLVAQSTVSPPGTPAGFDIPAPHHFSHLLRTCPLRVVLADDIVRCAVMLAYSDGDRLTGCLDLIHAPMETVWVEWTEATRLAALREVPDLAVRADATAKHAGLLIQSDKSGRAGNIRTFWSLPNEVAYTGSIITEFDLDNAIREAKEPSAIFAGQAAGINCTEEPGIDEILNHVRYRLDPGWLRYYRSSNLTEDEQTSIWRAALGTTAYDTPMILALFLLMAAKEGVQRREIGLERLNGARRRVGRAPLLEHVEASLHAHAAPTSSERDRNNSSGRPKRIHRVRGHLMRRGNNIFWRSSHLRGSARQGMIRTRTVHFRFQ
jgi:hypothetical protein